MENHAVKAPGWNPMLNPKITCRKIDKDYFGLFAAEDIRKGEFIWKAHESDSNLYMCLAMEEIEKLPENEKKVFLHFCYQIDRNLFSGYTSMDDVMTDEANFMNHSCDPNSWYEGDKMVARRDIRTGEEITYDYATDAVDRDWGFDCLCGSAICRGRLRRDDWKKLGSVYGDHFSHHVNKIKTGS
jgi:uncharacterized protein